MKEDNPCPKDIKGDNLREINYFCVGLDLIWLTFLVDLHPFKLSLITFRNCSLLQGTCTFTIKQMMITSRLKAFFWWYGNNVIAKSRKGGDKSLMSNQVKTAWNCVLRLHRFKA